MLLTIDIGNSTVFIGANEGGVITRTWRLSTDRERTGDEYGIMLKELFAASGLNTSGIKGAAMSCVVPSLRDSFVSALERYVGVTPLVIEPGVKTGMPIITDNPKEVGADRIVGAVAAYHKHKCELIVVDMGTAITFDHVTKKGEYAGGAIAPGVQISATALFKAAAKLPKVDISRPRFVVGKNTIDGLKSGIYFGFAALIDGMVERIKKETAPSAKVVATGGHAELFAKESKTINEVDELLILKGLEIIYEANAK
ncbi:MAG: type III pantothenate kinase [Deltaproteobacteria bacterium]|nr:type III pantothenate kinase [Deltaproteobacteria bacterium]